MFLRLATIILVFLAHITLAAGSERRVALVIGNSTYSNLGTLPNPKSDVELISSALTSTGFEVTPLIDVDLLGMRKAITEFGRKLRETGSVGLFYYAGHGVQVDGRNYLIPIDANIKDEAEVAWQTVDVTEFLKVMERSSSAINIVILDACRDNPLLRNFVLPVVAWRELMHREEPSSRIRRRRAK